MTQGFKSITVAIILATICFFPACSTLQKEDVVTSGKDFVISSSKNERVYRSRYESTFRASVDVLRRLESGSAKLVRFNDGQIIFQKLDGGGAIVVNVEQMDESATRVTISAKEKRKYWFDDTNDEIRELFFQELDKEIGSLMFASHYPNVVKQQEEAVKIAEPEEKNLQKNPSAEEATFASGTKTDSENAEEKRVLLARIQQELQMEEKEQFLQKLSYKELSLLNEKLAVMKADSAALESGLGAICANCYIDLARIYHDSAQYARAAEALKTAIAVDPENAVAHCNLGEIYKHLNQIDDAIRELETARQLSPELPDIYINLGIVYDDYVRDDRKAVEHYRKYLSLGGSDPQVLDWIDIIENNPTKPAL